VYSASPLATRRLPRVGFPAFRCYYEDATTAFVRFDDLVAVGLDTSSCLAPSLTPVAKSHSGVPGCCSCQCPPLPWPLPKRRQEALSSFQGTLSHICPALRPRPDHRVRLLTLWCCSRRHKDESSSNLSILRGSITRLLYSLHTLDAAISDDSPMLASGWLPPFPGGLLVLLSSCKEFLLLVIPSFPSFLDLS
jgi:hypothetical protein